MRRDRNVPPIGLIVLLKLFAKVQILFLNLLRQWVTRNREEDASEFQDNAGRL
jgi:hypothetical protein